MQINMSAKAECIWHAKSNNSSKIEEFMEFEVDLFALFCEAEGMKNGKNQ